MDRSQNWWFQRAPEPSDIHWENLKVSTSFRVCKGIQVYLATILIIWFSFTIVNSVKKWQISKVKELKEADNLSLYDHGLI
jgi:hypothetical protein